MEVGDDEDEGGVVEASDGVSDSSADLSWIEVGESCDLGGGVSISVHREEEIAILALEALGAECYFVRELGALGAAKVDGCGNLVEPIRLIHL